MTFVDSTAELVMRHCSLVKRAEVFILDQNKQKSACKVRSVVHAALAEGSRGSARVLPSSKSMISRAIFNMAMLSATGLQCS